VRGSTGDHGPHKVENRWYMHYGQDCSRVSSVELELGDPGSIPGSCHYSIG